MYKRQVELLQHAPLRERGGQPQLRQQRAVLLEGPKPVRRVGAQPEGLKPLPVIDCLLYTSVLEEFHWAGYVERTLIWGYGELP